MSPIALIVLLAGVATLAASALFLLRHPFERFVGLRYLRRGRPSKVAKTGLLFTGGLALVGVALVFLCGPAHRGWETAGVALVLVGGFVAALFVLLRTFSVFTTVSTFGVVLGVASLVVVLSVTSGFEQAFLKRVRVAFGDAVVLLYGEAQTRQELIERQREVERHQKKLADLPGLVEQRKFALAAGEVMIGKSAATFKGVDGPEGVAQLASFVESGRLDDLLKPAQCPDAPAERRIGRLALGAEFARASRIKAGDCVPMLVPFAHDEAGAPLQYTFKVVAITRVGYYEYDARYAFVPLEDLTWLDNARQMMFGIELHLANPFLAHLIEPEVMKRVGADTPVRVLDWSQLNHNMFVALNVQKVMISLFLLIIIVVAAFNIVAALTMIVLSRVPEIATLCSMGARKMAVLRIFVSAGAIIGFIGTALGLVLGLLTCAMISTFAYALDPKIYIISTLPVRVDPLELLAVTAATMLICLLATVYPAVRASRLKVVDGLRGS